MMKKRKFNFKSKIISATRRIWLYSPIRREVMQRCKTTDGFYRCERCRSLNEKVQIDHIQPSVPTTGWDNWDGFITRLFIDSSGLQGLCEKCHNKKTVAEQKQRKANRAEKITTVKKKEKNEI